MNLIKIVSMILISLTLSSAAAEVDLMALAQNLGQIAFPKQFDISDEAIVSLLEKAQEEFDRINTFILKLDTKGKIDFSMVTTAADAQRMLDQIEGSQAAIRELASIFIAYKNILYAVHNALGPTLELFELDLAALQGHLTTIKQYKRSLERG